MHKCRGQGLGLRPERLARNGLEQSLIVVYLKRESVVLQRERESPFIERNREREI